MLLPTTLRVPDRIRVREAEWIAESKAPSRVDSMRTVIQLLHSTPGVRKQHEAAYLDVQMPHVPTTADRTDRADEVFVVIDKEPSGGSVGKHQTEAKETARHSRKDSAARLRRRDLCGHARRGDVPEDAKEIVAMSMLGEIIPRSAFVVGDHVDALGAHAALPVSHDIDLAPEQAALQRRAHAHAALDSRRVVVVAEQVDKLVAPGSEFIQQRIDAASASILR